MMVRFQTGFAAQYRARRGSTLMTCRVYPPSPHRSGGGCDASRPTRPSARRAATPRGRPARGRPRPGNRCQEEPPRLARTQMVPSSRRT
jgi:hypothetical protein